MDKITYLAELAEGLARWVPERERRDILRYYAEYFEEAGQDRVAEVVAELGDPWALSCRLAVEGGYVTHEKAASWRPRKKRTRFLIGVAVGLAAFTLVYGMGLLGLLAFNVTRTVSSSPVHVFGEAEPVTVVDWGLSPAWGEYGVAYIEDDPSAAGFYYADGGNLVDFSSIDVDISLGNVEVVYGDDFTLYINYSDATEAWTPVWEVTGGTLRLRDNSRWTRAEVNSWEDFKNLFGASRQPVEVIITVPQNIALDRISVKTGLGNVTLWGLCAKIVAAETGVGNVECYNALEVRSMELNTGVGNVILDMWEVLGGLNVVLESGTGNVDATLCGPEEEYSYSLESGLGLVTVNGAVRGSSAERGGSAPCRLNAESGTGSVDVYFIGSEAATMENYTGFFFSQTN